ncbi:SusC/RagA family TonB-linked outer membrane protein [Wenyingzhuangia aestuarii]|uniref:SusC/RagA family TonB-linked outer membrane protein n=1 Tax=Wenyingzhuangia aestuarii TaxID=1647582 RepID=UPI00143B7FD2|nr:TonB-dependent receptor [Wenyingzhuangia aestuarii]NJB81651.1 TonB-linked SusC/RagA family outer membrane protein [Wenyingzhuangia aestuarii]
MKKNRTINVRTVLRKVFLILFLSVVCFQGKAYAQGTVSGVVTSSGDGLPLIGATIQKLGTKEVTTTDFDGQYVIKAKKGDVLQFTYLGMTPKSTTITGNVLNVILDPSQEQLDEVVVVGYGTQKKKEVTGAVAQVKSEEIEQFVTTDVSSALQGQVTGVNVTAASGEPGETASIQIRGVTSLIGSNEPLWVVDGIAQQGNPGLSPNEIETIDILKDAASAAIYGTEGAGGVILVTTKQGKEGKMSITLNSKYGIQDLGKGISLMNAKDELFFGLTQLDNGASTFVPGPIRTPEWLNNDNTFNDYVLVEHAATQQHTLNVSGGTKEFSYNAVGGYFNQEGTLINSGFQRVNGRISANYNKKNWKVRSSIAFTTEKRDRVGNNLITNAQRYSPLYPIVDPSSDVVYSTESGDGGVRTPLELLAQALKKKDNSTSERINASIGVTRQLTKDLSMSATLGTAITNTYRDQFLPQYSIVYLNGDPTETDPTKSNVTTSASRRSTLSGDIGLSYKKKIEDHNFGAQAIFAIKEEGYRGFSARKEGVLNNDIRVLDGASINPVADSEIYYNSTQVGFVGRVTYGYKDKYLLSGVVRRDGSSKFSPENQWGIFPSITMGWNVSDEPFWKDLKGTINNFKIRAGRGTVGNNRFGNYEYQSTIRTNANYIFDPTDNQLTFGSAVYTYANPQVKWETKTETNIGFDMSLWRNKLIVTADVYKSSNEDMLFPVRTPSSAGAYDGNNLNSILNVGNMTNQGLEIALKYRTNIQKSKLSTSLVFTRNTNEVTSTAGQSTIYNTQSNINSTPITVFAEGYEAGAYFLYKTNGAINSEERLAAYQEIKPDAKMGDIEIVDYNKNGKIDNDDRHYAGSALPDFELGWNMQWTYKGFDLSMNWYASVGSEIINGNKIEAYTKGRHKDLLDMWSKDNPTSNIPILRDFGTNNYLPNNDYWVESGDYIRLKLATLGYNFSQTTCEDIGLSSLRLFFTAQNPLTITKYTGYDPEVGGNVARRGLDLSRYPLASLYTVGLNVKF